MRTAPRRAGWLSVCATALVVAAAGLAACQEGGPPALSLEEAKKVTATFEGQSFTPPPRTIDDLTVVLDAEKPDPAKLAAARARLDAAPPPGVAGDALAELYIERGRAAEALGDLGAALSSYREAGKHARDQDLRSWIAHDTAVAEIERGNLKAGLESMRRSIDLIPGNVLGRGVVWYSVLASILGATGDLEGAEAALRQAQSIMDYMRTTWAWSLRGPLYMMEVDKAKAATLDAQGAYAEGEGLYRSALRTLQGPARNLLAAHRIGFHTDIVHAYLARNLTHQDRFVEAEIEARKALMSTLRRRGKYSGETASLVLRFLPVLSGRGRYAEAETMARATLDILGALGSPRDSFSVVQARQSLADALAAQDKWTEALAEYQAIEALGSADSLIFQRLLGDSVNRALAALKGGDAAKALSVARRVVERNAARKGASHYDTAESRGVLALTLAATGETAAARREFAEAIAILLQRSRRSDDERTTQAERDRRLRLILEGYIDLLGKAGDAASAAEAFRLANAARGQTVQRALSAASARAAAKDPALADLVRREQDALKRIGALNGLYAQAVSVPEDQQNRAALADLRARIDRLRGARAALAQEIDRRFPDYAALMRPAPATVGQARAALRAGEALIATYVGEGRSYVWAVPKAGPVRFASAPVGGERLRAMVHELRRALEPSAATLGGIPDFDVALSHRLYRALLAPVAAGWKDAKSLLVVAHGPLGELPFQVLVQTPATLPAEAKPLFAKYRGVAWLARDHAITVLPSVGSLATLRRLPPASPARRSFAGFGDPWFSQAEAAAAAAQPTQTAALAARGGLAVRGLPVHLRSAPALAGVASADLARLPRLPETADEVRSIALALKADLARDVFTGKAASEGRVKAMTLSGYKVVAFATHGLVPGDLNGLTQPALALTSPAVAGGKDDGLLTMGEILGLKLDADWVVLSACNTASGAGAGAEAVSGLGRAFFYAGTRALLVSNWPVETTSARALTTDLFRRQAADPGLARAEALRRTMMGLIDGPGLVNAAGRSVFSYAHPIFWAPFSLIGDGGGGAVGS